MSFLNMLDKEYNKKGYVHLKGILNETEILELRNLILKSNKEKSFVKEIDFFLEHNSIYKLQFNKTILKSIKEIFGSEAMLLNDINIQVEQFYNDRSDKGWHIDAGGEGYSKYLFHPSYGYAKVGVYLKSNSIETGGGVDIEEGSHKAFRYFGSGNLAYFFSLLYYGLDRILFRFFRKSRIINTNQGDVLIFDSRLNHRSTPRKSHSDVPKISIYWQVAKDSQNAKDYLRHAMKMAVSDKNNFKHYFQFLRYKYPDNYPKEYIRLAKNSILISNLSSRIAKLFSAEPQENSYDKNFFDN